MSRCFPFPPPGYEKKAIPDDTNLQIKEKHKEKKHKKDKKEKEKREGKEKKDKKERIKDKDKEKKDRKEKHKDRKDKDIRDKEKKGTSDEKKNLTPQECHNGEKLCSDSTQGDENRDSKFLLELGKRIRDEGGAAENQVVQKITVTDQRRIESSGKVVGNYNISNVIGNKEGNKEVYKERKEEKKASGQRSEVVARSVENPMLLDSTRMDQQKVEAGKPVEKDSEKQKEGKEKSKHRDSDSKGDRQKDKDREKKSKSKDKKRHKEKKREEKAKEKDPNKQLPNIRETGKDESSINILKPSLCILKENKKGPVNDTNLGKRKELEMNGFLHENELRPNKLPRLVPSSHQVVGNERKIEPHRTLLKLASSEREAVVVNHKLDNKVSSSHLVLENGRKLEPRPNNHKVVNKDFSSHPVLGNERELEPLSINQKVDNKASSSYPVPENGRKLEPPQHTIQAQDMVNNHKKDNKEHRINGLKETEPRNVPSVKPLSAPSQAKVKVEASVKPPHPDSKYLSQILSVPKMEESLGFDDQDWLFSTENLEAENPKSGPSEVDGSVQVWREALRIESADVTALPYVIPY